MSTASDPARRPSTLITLSSEPCRIPQSLEKYHRDGDCRSNGVKRLLATRRDDMLRENGHEGADEGLEPVFFPEACVVEVLPKEVVVWVLGCDCNRCETDAKYPSHCHVDRTLYSKFIMSRTLKLFAVLIHINHPTLISGLLNLHEDDRSMEDRHSDALGRMHKYWPNLHEGESGGGMDQIGLPEAEANGIVEAFLTARHLFLLPTIDSDSFVAFDDNRVLPLINQRQITKAKGNFGSVYSFQFYPGYLTLKGFSRRAKLARKEVSRHDGPVVDKEVKVLMTISRRLEHNKHFIKLLKLYQIGDKINFIFPLANGDLREYLYDGKQWKHLFNPHEPPFKNSIWSQMVGLLTALDEYQSLKDVPIDRRYHSDLKPRNILVFEEDNDDVLVVTDFGQAHIGKKVDPQGTTVTGQRPGTEAYAPPESHQKSTMNTKFDVWSMGCILLEVLVYVVEGPERVRELYEARDTGHGTDYYCCWDEDNRKYVINPGAVKIVGKLLRNYSTDIFILEVWCVILLMLQIDSRERSTSGEACQALKVAIDDARIRAGLDRIDWSADRNFGGSAKTSISQYRLAVNPFKQYHDEKMVIRRRQLEFSHLSNEFQKGNVQVTQNWDPEKGLRVVAQYESGDWAPSESGALGSLKLIPLYAFENQHESDEKQYTITFEGPIRYSFRFDQKEDAYKCQGALTGQHISLSLPVDVTIRSIPTRGGQSLGRCTIQLWKESNTHKIRTERIGFGRTKTMQMDEPPQSISRVIIFPSKAKSRGRLYFLSIPLLDDDDHFIGEINQHSFAIKRGGGAKIKCYEISARCTSTQSGRYPAIAISFEGSLFDQQEVDKGRNSNVQYCTSVYLTFKDDADCNIFAKGCQSLRKGGGSSKIGICLPRIALYSPPVLRGSDSPPEGSRTDTATLEKQYSLRADSAIGSSVVIGSSDSLRDESWTGTAALWKQYSPAADRTSRSTKTYPKIRSPAEIPVHEQEELWQMMTGKSKPPTNNPEALTDFDEIEYENPGITNPTLEQIHSPSPNQSQPHEITNTYMVADT
ncbi:kinase-like protein [Wilcoxina mikolae CBS 423.85]|nr:kinase-like protein [Wilcoxina mikolae CBS 423.85]